MSVNLDSNSHSYFFNGQGFFGHIFKEWEKLPYTRDMTNTHTFNFKTMLRIEEIFYFYFQYLIFFIKLYVI